MTERFTRREALGIIGATAAAAMLPGNGSAAKAPDFPKGAIIRTILKDVPPSALGNGATLFHEHLSLTAPYPYAAPTGRTIKPHWMGDVSMMVDEVKAAGKDGVSCFV